MTACAAGSVPQQSDEALNVRGGVTEAVEPLTLAVEGARLERVAFDPGHGYLAIGSKPGGLLVVRIDGKSVREESAPRAPDCAKLEVQEVRGVAIDTGRRGLVVGTELCTRSDGASGRRAFVLEIANGVLRRLENLPDEGGFWVRAVTCKDGDCLVLARKTKNCAEELGPACDSSITVYRYHGGSFTTEHDEWETDPKSAYWPNAIAFWGASWVAGGEDYAGGVLRIGGEPAAVSAPVWALHESGGHLELLVKPAPGQNELVRMDEDRRVTPLASYQERIYGVANLAGRPLAVGERDAQPGFTAYAVREGNAVTLPESGDASTLLAVAGNGETALAVGEQTNSDEPRKRFPLIVHFTAFAAQ